MRESADVSYMVAVGLNAMKKGRMVVVRSTKKRKRNSTALSTRYLMNGVNYHIH